jgi:hypothetical protein
VHGSNAGISLYIYLYLKLAKSLSFLLSHMFSFQQNWRRGQYRFFLEARGVKGRRRQWGEMAQTMYAHMNK